MRRDRIVVTKGAEVEGDDATTVITFETLKASMRGLQIARDALRYHDATLRTDRLDTLSRPFASAALIRTLSRGSASIEDLGGRRIELGPSRLFRMFRAMLRDRIDA